MPSEPPFADAARTDRAAQRTRLRADRDHFATQPAFAAAEAALGQHLTQVLMQLEPQTLGLYWPMRCEFNPVPACAAQPALGSLPWALPFCLRQDRAMQYRAWDRQTPSAVDECRLPTGAGALAHPDVVLLPCVGYTDDGFRLGYGAGYFDRWLAAHPGVTAVGVAWSINRIAPGDFTPAAHDQPLAIVVTEAGAFAP